MVMWPSWVKTRATKSKPSASPSTPLSAAARRFSFSFADPSPSLKDIQSLVVHPEPARPPRVFHRLRVAASALRFLRALQPAPAPSAALEVEPEVRRPCVVVIYFTSLRVVRRTYEDSYTVCFILRGIGATVEERDLATDRAYIDELAALLPCGQALTIPQVFVDGRHLGGVEEVQRLHESGELNRIVGVASSPSLAPARPPCGCCGGRRHVPCGSCDGSREQYSDLACDACNENGLVRCPDCLFPEAA